MTLVEHLTELRTRLIICVVAVAVGMLAGFLLYDWIFDFLLQPYKDIATSENALADGKLLQTDPLEGFGIRMKTSAYSGIALAMPVILWQLWRFVTPGLYPNEKRWAVPFVASALALFVLGAGLAYYTLPRGRRFAIVGICILVAVITPSGDPISMLMLSVPMVIFYEIAIVIGSVITKRRALRDAT